MLTWLSFSVLKFRFRSGCSRFVLNCQGKSSWPWIFRPHLLCTFLEPKTVFFYSFEKKKKILQTPFILNTLGQRERVDSFDFRFSHECDTSTVLLCLFRPFAYFGLYFCNLFVGCVCLCNDVLVNLANASKTELNTEKYEPQDGYTHTHAHIESSVEYALVIPLRSNLFHIFGIISKYHFTRDKCIIISTVYIRHAYLYICCVTVEIAGRMTEETLLVWYFPWFRTVLLKNDRKLQQVLTQRIIGYEKKEKPVQS